MRFAPNVPLQLCSRSRATSSITPRTNRPVKLGVVAGDGAAAVQADWADCQPTIAYGYSLRVAPSSTISPLLTERFSVRPVDFLFANGGDPRMLPALPDRKTGSFKLGISKHAHCDGDEVWA